jgi:hypothetical protein
MPKFLQNHPIALDALNYKAMKPAFYSFKLAILFIACGNQNIPDKHLASVSAKSVSDTTINFENSEPGKIPTGFTASYTGTPQHLDWKVVKDNGHNVVAQLAKNSGNYYNLLVLDKQTYDNFKVSVRIKAIAGEEDQGGGLACRLSDNNNYYIARLNPLENNLRLYKVVDGGRIQLKSVDTGVNTGEWFTMTIEMNGNKIVCSINGEPKISITDDTFKSGGRVGLWSKADAQTWFDDLTIHPIN